MKATKQTISINSASECCPDCGANPNQPHDDGCEGGQHRLADRLEYLLEQSSFDESDYPLIRALCEHLDCEPSDLSEASYKHYGELRIFEHGSAKYAVGTDSEADDAWDASLDSYIEDCITPEIDKLELGGNLSIYVKFDEEMWKRDARMDGRGHSLSSYDGNEDEIDADGETFYLYRIN